jgi:hypothetical protein
VTGTQVEGREYAAIVIATSVKNDGLSQVRFLDDLKVVSVFGLRASQWIPGIDQDWGEQLMILTVLDGHEWIEAQETITDQVLVAVPDDSDRTDPWLAFRLVLRVASEGRRDKRLKWTATAVVPAALRSADEDKKGALRRRRSALSSKRSGAVRRSSSAGTERVSGRASSRRPTSSSGHAEQAQHG